MSIWEDNNLEAIVRKILIKGTDRKHHLGNAFFTPYQIAIEIKNEYTDAFDAIPNDIGGKGYGEHTSVSQYIARQLSQRIKKVKLLIWKVVLYPIFT